MTLQLNDEIERLIASRLRTGKYGSAEDVLRAALAALGQDERRGQFEAGEWNALLADGERGTADLDGEQVLDELRSLRRPGASE